MIDSKLIAQLREKTGAGIVDVKAALDETNGDMTAAEELLRKKGILKAGKKSDRVAGEGIVYSYIHGGGCFMLVQFHQLLF
jgi:elongation factor Ts